MGVFIFEFIINVLVSSFCFIWIPMFCVYGHFKYFTLSGRGSTSDAIDVTHGADVCAPLSLTNILIYWEKTTIH